MQAVAVADVLRKLAGLRALGRFDGGTLGSMRALLPSTALLVLRSAAIAGTFSFATAAATRRDLRSYSGVAHQICLWRVLCAVCSADVRGSCPAVAGALERRAAEVTPCCNECSMVACNCRIQSGRCKGRWPNNKAVVGNGGVRFPAGHSMLP